MAKITSVPRVRLELLFGHSRVSRADIPRYWSGLRAVGKPY
jgi:hypothetical protein